MTDAMPGEVVATHDSDCASCAQSQEPTLPCDHGSMQGPCGTMLSCGSALALVESSSALTGRFAHLAIGLAVAAPSSRSFSPATPPPRA